MQRGYSFYEKNGCLIGQLYDTIVFSYNPDTRQVKFNTGGYHTRSTVKAMNTSLELTFETPKHRDRIIKGIVIIQHLDNTAIL